MRNRELAIPESKRSKQAFIRVLLYIFIFVFYTYIAFSLGLGIFDGGPDEVMRSLVPRCILNGELVPSGYDECAIYDIGYWSYAFYPQMLSAYLSAFFMSLARMFGISDDIVFMCGRFASIFFAMIAVYAVANAIRTIFASSEKRFFLEICSIILLGFWPQFAFLSTYMNNDIVALSGVAVMFSALISGMKLGWNIPRGLLFAVGVVFCGLGYWNSYGFILVLVVVFILSVILQYQSDHKKVISIIASSAGFSAILVVPWFILNFIRYGDMIGMSVFRTRMNEWIATVGEGSSLQNPYMLGIRSLLLDTDYVENTLQSFVGNIGYMAIELPFVFTIIFYMLVGVSAGLSISHLRARMHSINYVLLLAGAIIGSIITIGLSLYYSTRVDYQPQGRYIIYILVPIIMMIVVAIGDSFELKSYVSIIAAVLLLFAYIAICLYYFNTAMLEYGWSGVHLNEAL